MPAPNTVNTNPPPNGNAKGPLESTWHICYATDANYAFLAGISICSICETNSDALGIHFHILDNGITDEQKRKMTELVTRYARDISFYPIEAPMRELMTLGAKSWNNSYATWARLFLGTLLPAYVKRILYLDSDTLVLRSLRELFSTSISAPLVCAAVKDCCQVLIGPQRQEQVAYYNAGVLLFQLDRWRDTRCEERLLQTIRDTNAQLPCVDQGVLNATLAHSILSLPLACNTFSFYPCIPWRWILCIYALTPSRFYPEEEYNRACSAPTIVHMMGNIAGRPWESGNTNPFTKQFRHCKALSPWADEPDWPHIQHWGSPLFRLQLALYRHAPGSLYCAVTAIASHLRMKSLYRMLAKKGLQRYYPSRIP
ncbi:MAG: glycosyltransferase family 8 protein [Kiritimatiellae bacterium]|nr:glycosyltransferase family 8 protein [Kiritimatiellia bacterium]